MATDTSIYALTKPTVELKDPNAVLQQTADAQNAVLRNRLAQAGEARGQALQRATNPLTGQVDMGQANTYLAADPRGAMAMPEAVNQATAVNTSQNELAAKQNGYLSQSLAAVLKLPDDQLHAGVATAMNRAVNMGLVPGQSALFQMSTLPQEPGALRQHLTQLQLGLMGPGQQRDAIYGTNAEVNDGASSQFGTRAPVDSATPGAFNPAGNPVRQQLSPADRTAPVQIGTDKNGAPIYGQKQQFIGATGGDRGAAPAGAPAGAPGSSLGNGRFPDALRNPNRVGGQAPAAAAPAATGDAGAPPLPPANQPIPAGPALPGGGNGVVTGMGPAQTAAASTDGTNSANAFQAIADQGTQARSQSSLLGGMLADTSGFDSGETYWNAAKAKLTQQIPGAASWLGIKPEDVAKYESFEKFANQLASQQGSGSDARLSVAQNANPSSKMSKEGLDLVLRQLQGNADYLRARQQLAAQHPDRSDARGFEATTGARLDPRAFQFARMTQPQREAYDKGLSKTDKAQVRASYNYALENKLVTPPPGWTAQSPAAPAAAPAPARTY